MMKKRICYSILLAVLMVTLGFGFSPAPQANAAANASLPAEDAAYVPGQLIVGFVPSVSLGSTAARASGVAQTVGAKVLRTGDQGMALLDVGQGMSVRVMAVQIKRMKGVRYAEPNYISKLVDPVAETGVTPPTDYIIRETQGRNSSETIKAAYPVAGLQAMKSIVKGASVSTYPNDPQLWWNAGWHKVGADIVWNNTTASKNVCELDTGVDYTHPDLKANIIKGYDFVNDDTDPMDDYGHGTHVAGIMAAIRNNGQGIAGVSTGKVVAVKVLDTNGVGTAYDIALGIDYCANRSDVNILNLSLGGAYSLSEATAVGYAVGKGKLVVAAAGNGNTSVIGNSYPAAFASGYAFSYGVVAVAASGFVSGSSINYDCRAGYSNYGTWVTLVAPGTSIYSTLPWDKPFGLHNWSGYKERYDYLSGTSMATPFVSAVAARAWGYQPGLSAAQVVQRMKDTGFQINADGTCWPASMSGMKQVNVARALDRGAASFSIRDAITDMPIVGATASVYSGSTLKGSSVITTTSPIDATTGMVNIAYTDWADVLNLPASYNAWTGYTPKVSATKYTASAQAAFVGDMSWSSPNGTVWLISGWFSMGGYALVPPKMANFTVTAVMGYYRPHLALWLPIAYPYIVSPTYYHAWLGDVDVLPFGSLNEHPYARWMNYDATYESLVIHNRTSDSAAPWYTGTYQVGITDGFTSGTNYLDNDFVSALVWKDGVIKYRVDKGILLCGTNHWWFPLLIISPTSGAATYSLLNTCGTLLTTPY